MELIGPQGTPRASGQQQFGAGESRRARLIASIKGCGYRPGRRSSGTRVGGQLRPLDHSAELSELFVVTDGDDDVAIAHFDPGRARCWDGHCPAGAVPRRMPGNSRAWLARTATHRVEQCHVDMLAEAVRSRWAVRPGWQ